MPDNTQQEFLKDLEPVQVDPFEAPLEEVEKPIEEVEEPTETPVNRRERRLMAKYQAERESSIALAARLEGLTEAQKFSQGSTQSSYEEKAARIYGNATPENAAATELLLASLKDLKEEATKTALETFREESRKEREAISDEEKTLDGMIEDIEDESGLTLDANTKKSFFQLLEKLSPKDREGNVVNYADHFAVWEEFQARKKPADNRAKDLASRSRVQTGATSGTTTDEDASLRYLREQGLL